MSLMSTIYVYCDIVEPQVIGDTNAQLLKTIPVEGKFGDVIAGTFTNIQYVPIQRRSFENIEILLGNDTGDPVPFERGKVVIIHYIQTAQLFYLQMNNPYIRYYLEQQQGRGISVFRGSPWQMGHGQMGNGLGGLFRSVARSVMPMLKSGAKALGNIALHSGKNLLGDVLAVKNVKEAAKARVWRLPMLLRTKRWNVCGPYAQTGGRRRTNDQEQAQQVPNVRESNNHP